VSRAAGRRPTASRQEPVRQVPLFFCFDFHDQLHDQIITFLFPNAVQQFACFCFCFFQTSETSERPIPGLITPDVIPYVWYRTKYSLAVAHGHLPINVCEWG